MTEMNAPGISLHSIRNIAGGNECCPVFFNHVRVSDVGGGRNWNVARVVLDRRCVVSPKQPTNALNRFTDFTRTAAPLDEAGRIDNYTRHRPTAALPRPDTDRCVAAAGTS